MTTKTKTKKNTEPEGAVNRQRLLDRLNAVRPGLSPEETAQQTNCFVFSEGWVYTYNQEIACRMKSRLPKELRCAVLAKPLLAHLALLPDEDVRVDLGESVLNVYGAGDRHVEVSMRADAGPMLDWFDANMEDPEEWKPLPEEFADAASIAVPIAAATPKEEQKSCLKFVHIHPEFVQACDNTQMVRYDLEMPIKGDFFMAPAALKAAMDARAAEISETAAWVHFKGDDGLFLACRRHENTGYPQLTKVMKFDGEKVALPNGLADAVKSAAVSAAEIADDPAVILELSEGQVTVHGLGIASRYHETKQIDYHGPAMSFKTAPKAMEAIAKKFQHCIVAPDKMRVDGPKWRYCVRLYQAQKPKTTPELHGEEDGD